MSYAANHQPGRERRWARSQLSRVELFDDLDDAKRACDRWRRTGCRQSITELETGERWVRFDSDGEWIPAGSHTRYQRDD